MARCARSTLPRLWARVALLLFLVLEIAAPWGSAWVAPNGPFPVAVQQRRVSNLATTDEPSTINLYFPDVVGAYPFVVFIAATGQSMR